MCKCTYVHTYICAYLHMSVWLDINTYRSVHVYVCTYLHADSLRNWKPAVGRPQGPSSIMVPTPAHILTWTLWVSRWWPKSVGVFFDLFLGKQTDPRYPASQQELISKGPFCFCKGPRKGHPHAIPIAQTLDIR